MTVKVDICPYCGAVCRNYEYTNDGMTERCMNCGKVLNE